MFFDDVHPNLRQFIREIETAWLQGCCCYLCQDYDPDVRDTTRNGGKPAYKLGRAHEWHHPEGILIAGRIVAPWAFTGNPDQLKLL